MTFEIHQIDAFAERPFEGNPAAVCFTEDLWDGSWMQAVAAEMNLSETAFLRSRGGEFDLRWFTPTMEVDLCGHATLASAHYLWDTGRLEESAPARFHTASGRLSAELGRDGRITLDFPSEPPRKEDHIPGLLDSLGCKAVWVGSNRMDHLVEVRTEAEVLALRPDFASLTACTARGVMVTARSERKGVDFVSRFFAPAAGVDEDPVTGSAHCCLAPYWGDKLHRQSMVGVQVSRRTGRVQVEPRGDRVLLTGTAITVLRGELVAEPSL